MGTQSHTYIKKSLCAIILNIANVLYPNEINKIKATHIASEQYLHSINKSTLVALIAIEDKRFFTHWGFDILAISRALYNRIIYKKRSGASTIDQQLVRTITNHREYSIARKLKEILLAVAINAMIDKQTIIKLYLWVAYYGWQMNGYKACLERLQNERTVHSSDIDLVTVALLRYPLPQHVSSARLACILNRVELIKSRLR